MKEQTVKTTAHAGVYGNVSSFIGTVVFEGEGSGAKGVLGKLPKGCQVLGVNVVGDGGATIAFGFQEIGGSEVNGVTGFIDTPFANTAELYIKTSGGTATGTVNVVVSYIYHGA